MDNYSNYSGYDNTKCPSCKHRYVCYKMTEGDKCKTHEEDAMEVDKNEKES